MNMKRLGLKTIFAVSILVQSYQGMTQTNDNVIGADRTIPHSFFDFIKTREGFRAVGNLYEGGDSNNGFDAEKLAEGYLNEAKRFLENRD